MMENKHAKTVYDPTVDRHAAKHPIKPNAHEVIETPKVETPKTEAPKVNTHVEEPKIEKPKAEKKTAPKDLDVQVIATMKTLTQNGVKEFTSTLLRDKLALDREDGRDQIRKVMRKLEAEGKVAITEKPHGKAKQYVYSLKE